MPKVNGTVPAQSARQEETHAAKLSSLVDHLSRRYSNPALQVDTTHRISMSDTAIPCPAPTEALIHVRCSGICGSDLHLWHRGRIGTLTINGPCILGHEAAGQVLAVGAKVTKVKPGDRVAIEPGVPCHECWLCRSGRYNLCERVGFCGVGTPGCGGSIRRFMCHDAKYCHVMPASMSWSQGALLEPLSVVMHAVSECRGAVALGRPVLICGAGPIGLIALKAAQASGAWPLVITDVNAGRLEFAETLVPGVRTWRVDAAMNEVQTADAVRSLFGCKGDRDVEHGVPDEQEYVAPGVVLECTGIEGSVVTAAYACRRGGTVMVIGVGRDKMNNLPFMHMSLAEIQLKFINRYRDTWPAAINLLADRRVLDLDALVTHLFELERSVEAMETCADPSLGSVKIHIVDNTQVEIDV
jgi:L-iditol 2-dehydrogenase